MMPVLYVIHVTVICVLLSLLGNWCYAQQPQNASKIKEKDTDTAQFQSQEGRQIVAVDVRTSNNQQPLISFFIRYPKNYKPGERPNGVLTYVTWHRNKKSLKQWMISRNSSDPYLNFADKHGIAIVTWNTAHLHAMSSDNISIDKHTMRDPDNLMEKSFRAWKRGIKILERDYQLPQENYFLYGPSLGAFWGQWYVMRNPQQFLAAHVHVSAAYVIPQKEANRCLWLISTTELDVGLTVSRQFYEQTKALNYPVLFRVYPNLAHATFPQQEALGAAFFEYAMKLQHERLNLLAKLSADLSTEEQVKTNKHFFDEQLEIFNSPPYYGNSDSGEVLPANQVDFIPTIKRVPIPDKLIAEAWGYFNDNAKEP